MLDAQCALTGFLLTGFGFDHGGVDTLVNLAAPLPGDAAGFLKCDRVIGADDAPVSSAPAEEPCAEDKCDLTSLAAPRVVAILGVADADTEAGDAVSNTSTRWPGGPVAAPAIGDGLMPICAIGGK